MEPVGLWLGVRDGTVEMLYEPQGNLMLNYTALAESQAVEKERADAEAQRADEEAQRAKAADAENKRFVDYLRSLGVDPEEHYQIRSPLFPGIDTFRWTLPPEAHSSHYIAERVEDFLATVGQHSNQDKRPFFLHVSFPDPHYPFMVPEPYASIYKPHDMPPPLPPVTGTICRTSISRSIFIEMRR